MCGSGAIPIEAAIEWPNCVHLAGDNFEFAVEKSYENLKNLNFLRAEKNLPKICVDFFVWDATQMPLASESVDCFITDLPFGKRLGSKKDNRVLYKKFLFESARSAKLGTGRGIFLTKDKKNFFGALRSCSNFWKEKQVHNVNVGGLMVGAFVLKRTKVIFDDLMKVE